MDADIALQMLFAKCERLQAENKSLKERIKELEKILSENNIHGTIPNNTPYRKIEKRDSEDNERKPESGG